MTYETILLERLEGGVARITLNRPARVNALDVRTLKELNLALDEIELDTGIHAVILTGAGGSFSSGFDLKEQAESGPTGPEEWREALRYDFDTVTRFWHFPKPTLAAVPGACLAGGLELALCCDITIASENAFFGEPELKFGAGIVVMVLPWIVGPKVAKDIILTGEDRITAQRAYEIGLITRIVPADELQEAALRIARRVAVVDPDLVRDTKRAINVALEAQGLSSGLAAALDIDIAAEGRRSPDKVQFMSIVRQEGLRAALAWRERRFAEAEPL
ncbi:enoyl-CoA hydratase/isomerase family protein [Rhodomicrobium lacus]|uniref:enoyl-CoA hydratase/isomerase family protein n=1 Tax=Rhodomicrobium lacus TaxID=2498452 RepID=UPI0026E4811E|nr:enoyl-CoA hydratase/isomerase family protein [Rhodomicrobium lacus]WKW51391.1 enoyl-CoA hydratase/isomerase family protein [Rhodomicrobium lacus]